MAVWHFGLIFLPVDILKDRDNTIVIYITEDDINKRNPWKGRNLDFSLFEKIAKETNSWSKNIRMWGKEHESTIDVIFEKEQVIEVSARIDLRGDYLHFCLKLVELAKRLDCWIYIVSVNQCFEPDMNTLLAFLRKSLAYKYMVDPVKALTDLKNYPNRE
jgi:hypothetical protein